MFNECCAYITYEHYKENEYIFRAGDIGDKFYILLQGEASVLVPEKTEGNALFKEIFVYRDGGSFGDLALTEGKTRAATIKTKKRCHLAVLDKNSYQRILSNLMKKKKA